MLVTRGRLVVLILGLAAAAWAVGEMEGLSLTPDLFPTWSPAAAAAQSLQAWELHGPALEWLAIAAYIALIVWVASLYLGRLGALSVEQPPGTK